MKFAYVLAMWSVLAALESTLAVENLAGKRPNIILVMADDQGFGDLACHGNPLIQTPNLDRMYAESVRLTDFQVSPTCAPTRCSIMTGRHEFKSGVTHTILERERMDPRATTIAEVLKSAGYSTGIFGKWHLGDEAEYQPEQRGFDEVYIHGGGGIGQTYPGSCGDAPGNSYFHPALLHNGKFEKTEGYCTDLFFAQALRWIDEQSKNDAPFFVYITPNAPHSPHISPGEKYDELYRGKTVDGKPLDENAVAYYSMITNIDENMGRLFARLDELGETKDTLVVYLSDNGGTHTHLFSAGMRASKGSPYQGGTHVPCFWRWPGTLPAGEDIDRLTAHIDFFATFAALAGTKVPEGVDVDGRNLLPLIEDPSIAWPDRYIFVHQGRWPRGQVDDAKYTNCAVRNQRFRFVNNAELYDLTADPGETTNVIEQYPEVVANMREAYDHWWQDARAGMVNEDAEGPDVNPMKARYWEQFGGGPDAELAEKMKWENAGQFQGRPRRRKPSS